jgi:hypothetical protein
MNDDDLRRRYEELKASGDTGENEAADGTPEGTALWNQSLHRRAVEAIRRGDRREAMEKLSMMEVDGLVAVVRSAEILADLARDEGRRQRLRGENAGGPEGQEHPRELVMLGQFDAAFISAYETLTRLWHEYRDEERDAFRPVALFTEAMTWEDYKAIFFRFPNFPDWLREKGIIK